MDAYRQALIVMAACVISSCGKPSPSQSSSSPTPLPLTMVGNLDEYLQRYATFKQRMMPKVGQTITTTALIQFGKMGLHMPLQDGDVWIYDTKESDLPKMNELISRFDRHVVTVSGPLRHQDSTAPPDLPPDAEVSIQYVPDHFYFDVAEITMSEAIGKQ